MSVIPKAIAGSQSHSKHGVVKDNVEVRGWEKTALHGNCIPSQERGGRESSPQVLPLDGVPLLHVLVDPIVALRGKLGWWWLGRWASLLASDWAK